MRNDQAFWGWSIKASHVCGKNMVLQITFLPDNTKQARNNHPSRGSVHFHFKLAIKGFTWTTTSMTLLNIHVTEVAFRTVTWSSCHGRFQKVRLRGDCRGFVETGDIH